MAGAQDHGGAEAVVLDLDGTLVDSVYQHVVAWRSAFLTVGVDVPAWRIHGAIGIGGDRLVTEVAGDAVESAVGDDVRALHGDRFEALLPQVTPTPGAGELLERLRARGLTVVVASSGEAAMTDRLLSLVEPAESLHPWVAGDQADRSKPAPDLLDLALEKADAPASRALMVGDAVWDVETARTRSIPCVGVLTGGVSKAALLDAGAVGVFADPAELALRLDGVMPRQGRSSGSSTAPSSSRTTANASPEE